MYIATSYETDNSISLTYIVAIYIKFNGELLPNNAPQNFLIPQVLWPYLKWFDKYPCPTKELIARFVTITLLSGDILQVGYPFKPGSPTWFTFWEQLESSEIVSVQGFGEKVTDKLARNLLGII